MHVRSDAPVLDPSQDLFDLAHEARPLAHERHAPEDAHQRAALQQHEVRRNARDVPRREPDDQHAAVPRRRSERGLGVRAADGIVDDVCSCAVGERLHALLQILRDVVHEEIRAVPLARLELLRRRRGGDDTRPHPLADLHRREPHAARGPQHEQRLTRLEMRAIPQRVHGRPVRRRHARRAPEVDAVRDAQHLRRVGRELLRHAAPDRHREHAIAHAQALDACPHRLDHPRDLAPRRERRRRLELVLPLHDQ